MQAASKAVELIVLLCGKAGAGIIAPVTVANGDLNVMTDSETEVL